ncbi:21829_t:CDS:1, partial [Gigaspora rosea]
KPTLINTIHRSFFENKENTSIVATVYKPIKKIFKTSDQIDIPKVSDQQFVQGYLSNKEFNYYPDIKEDIIKLFCKEYNEWRNEFLSSVDKQIKDS